MKINLVKDKSNSQTEKVEKVIKTLYPDVEVVTKTKFYASELDMVIQVSSVYDKSEKEIAKKVIEITGLGVSDKLFNLLGD